jgi:hypothetical protein
MYIKKMIFIDFVELRFAPVGRHSDWPIGRYYDLKSYLISSNLYITQSLNLLDLALRNPYLYISGFLPDALLDQGLYTLKVEL